MFLFIPGNLELADFISESKVSQDLPEGRASGDLPELTGAVQTVLSEESVLKAGVNGLCLPLQLLGQWMHQNLFRHLSNTDCWLRPH